MAFGFFRRKQLPLIRDEDIQPVGEPIKTAEAKRLFREALTGLSGRMKLSRGEVSDYAYEFADEMRTRVEDMADEIKTETENGAELKTELKSKRKILESVSEGENRENILDEISYLEEDISDKSDYLEEIKNDLANFKKDKRDFLREKLNEAIQQYNDG